MKTVKNFPPINRTSYNSFVEPFLPKTVVIPLRHEGMEESICSFKVGDNLREGQMISSFANAVNFHSSVPGTIVSVQKANLPDNSVCNSLVIKTDGEFEFLGRKRFPDKRETPNSDALLQCFRDRGIVNTFSTGKIENLVAQIEKGAHNKNRFVVVRMFDDDLSRLTDSFLSQNYTSEIVHGAAIAAKAFNADALIFVLPKDSLLDLPVPEDIKYYCVNTDVQKYPSGFAGNLLKAVHGFSKTGECPELLAVRRSNSIFIDVQTAIDVFEAIEFSVPVIERFVQVSGKCLNAEGIFKVRVGTLIKDLVEQCGGFKIKPSKIVVNGLVLGNAVSTLETPVTKYLKSIHFLGLAERCIQKESPCINCALCRRVCPEGLVPDLLFRYSSEKYYLEEKVLETAKLCSGCSLCNSVCPSRIPLSQTISFLSSNIDSENANEKEKA